MNQARRIPRSSNQKIISLLRFATTVAATAIFSESTRGIRRILDALAHGRFVVVIEVLEEGSGIYAGHVCFRLTICPLLRQRRRVGCQRGSPLAGREFFPFRCFEHRIMASGAGYTSAEGAADVGGDTGSSKSLALKPKRESGANLPRNISTRMGVCRVEAVRLTSVSPRV